MQDIISEKYSKGDTLSFAIDYMIRGPNIPSKDDFLQILKNNKVDVVKEVELHSKTKKRPSFYFKLYTKKTEDIDKILALTGYKDKNVRFTNASLYDINHDKKKRQVYEIKNNKIDEYSHHDSQGDGDGADDEELKKNIEDVLEVDTKDKEDPEGQKSNKA